MSIGAVIQEEPKSIDVDDGSRNDMCSEDRLNEIIDENEGLRKGMHEILDSIRLQDGT